MLFFPLQKRIIFLNFCSDRNYSSHGFSLEKIVIGVLEVSSALLSVSFRLLLRFARIYQGMPNPCLLLSQ